MNAIVKKGIARMKGLQNL
jgi:hypothetical protein